MCVQVGHLTPTEDGQAWANLAAVHLHQDRVKEPGLESSQMHRASEEPQAGSTPGRTPSTVGGSSLVVVVVVVVVVIVATAVVVAAVAVRIIRYSRNSSCN